MVMATYRRSVAAETRRKSKGGKGSWYDAYRLPAAPAGSTPIIFQPKMDMEDPCPPQELIEIDPATGRPRPVLVPYFKGQKHKRKMPDRPYPLDELCTRGWVPHAPKPCCGCYASESGDKSVSLSDFFTFPIVHLAYYHGHPMIDKQTRTIKMMTDNSGPVIIYDECIGRTCNYCRIAQGQSPFPPSRPNEEPFPMYDPRSLTMTFGKRRYLELGKNHLGNVMEIDESVSSLCGRCRSTLTTMSFFCPTCHSVIIDMSNDPRSDEQIAVEAMKPYPCMKCQRPVFLQEHAVCESCQSQSQEAILQTGFDVVLHLRREGENTGSHIAQQKPFETIEDFARNVNPAVLNGKTLRDHIMELAKPYDFDHVYAPPTMEKQADRLKLPMPPGMGTVPQGPQYGAYPGQQPPSYPNYAPPPQQSPTNYPQPQQPGPQPFVPPGRPNYGQ